MKRPQLGTGAFSIVVLDVCKGLYSTSIPAPQVNRPSRIRDAADSAARLSLYRQDLDRYHGRPPGCRMPQPADFGLAMACCSSRDVLWGAS